VWRLVTGNLSSLPGLSLRGWKALFDVIEACAPVGGEATARAFEGNTFSCLYSWCYFGIPIMVCIVCRGCGWYMGKALFNVIEACAPVGGGGTARAFGGA
jgi:hypothetical protein